MPVQWTLILPPLAGRPTRQVQLEGVLKVGRASRNDIAIEDQGTSASHATMEVRGNELFVRDHGSTNGTAINGGSRLTMGDWTSVPDGATVRFGLINARIVGKKVTDRGASATNGQPPEAVAAGATEAARAAYALAQVYARLILLDPNNPGAARVTEMTQTIGRSMSMDFRIDSELVSSEHAALSYSLDTRAYKIQELGSSNHTVLNGAVLAPMAVHPLPLDSALRFGPIDAAFRVDHDIDGQRLPPNFDLKIAEALIAAGKLTDAELNSALEFAKATGGFLGDGLLLSGAVTPKDWADAAKVARQRGPAVSYRDGKSSSWLSKTLVAVLFLTLAIATVLLLTTRA